MEKIIFNIGRQFGSGGKEVAQTVGRMLGIPVYDDELLLKAAQESGLSKETFKGTDEKRRLFSAGSSMFDNNIFWSTDNCVSDANLFAIQSSAILSIAGKGSAVIVGRCSDYVLRDLPCTVDVFITAPDVCRVKRVAGRLGLDAKKAGELIQKKDRKRESYYNYYTFGQWGVASNYDLCIDSSILGIEGTAEFIIEFARKTGKLK
ncbi:MAG: AAA family ATPase [Candidatus Cryptobacteroides sp.]